ncbi:hypothetical protein F3Y22_tig00111779pilonHSYRG00076 [Hibiscus syriacus]|uniref:DRT100 protein n=1 Tax=Hibiscus syriacus TaxID=106335 RepID=A0A6A2YGU7_HIBSY|nr:hypothetical protein F3Y22_tig00111779pilonHSYRG00076 [Hibiscus syriacus]
MGIFSFAAVALPLLLSILSGAVFACPPSDREALLSSTAIRRFTDVSLRGESEDPILQKPGHSNSGYMTGSINPSVFQLDKLSTLIIADWKGITGQIPPCVAPLPNLRVLDLIGNSLSGKIPTHAESCFTESKQTHRNNPSFHRRFGNMNRLADLDSSINKLRGQIPAQLGKMKVLATLNLHNNMFSGTIPAAVLGNSGYMVLDLSFNNPKGSVPKSLLSAKYVGHLDLSHNRLCGEIPVGTPFDHLEASSFDGNEFLCGNPL